MLVLSRKQNEVVRVGHDVIITIIDIRGDKVRLGIEAPNEMPVHRQEVYELAFPSVPLPKPKGVPFDE
jgi:carbon storage regulator